MKMLDFFILDSYLEWNFFMHCVYKEVFLKRCPWSFVQAKTILQYWQSFDDYKNERSSGKYRTINFAEDVPHKDIPDTDCRNYILKFQLIKSLCFRNNATIMKHTSAFTKVLRNIYAFPIHQNSYEKSVFHIV